MNKRWFLNKIALLLAMSLIPSFALFAEGGARVLTYNDALKLARGRSELYKIATIQKDNTILNANVSKDWIPLIGLSSSLYTGQLQSFGPLSPMSTGLTELNKWTTVPSNSLNFKLSLGLQISGGKFANIGKAAATKDSATATYNKTLQGYDSSVFASYWGLKSAELAESAAEISYNSAKKTYDNTLLKYNAGRVSSLDKANATLSLSKSETSLINARTATLKQKVAFKTLIGYDGQIPFTLEAVPESIKLDLPDTETLYKEYINTSYDIRVARANEKSARSGADSVKWSYYVPTVSAGLSWGVNTSDSNFTPNQYRDNLAFSLTASLSLDGFIPGTTAYTQIKSAENSANIALLSRQNAEKNFLSSVEEARGAVNANYESLNSAYITLQNAEESYRLTKESYDNGKSTMESLMNAEAMLLNARTGLISSNMTYMLSQHTLATTLGITLDELQAKYRSTDTNGINVESAVPSDGQSNNISNN